ncbi:uncharacterized protein LOC117813771 isoform X2 [Notolabrus celidotus]|uniref:uncharacterized protein LOC117813771 isoform X2 n=1 Tax=Notolabrus celidotus TaxID=1203425 RepID=UPI00148F51ED|nr:uncharacterized protein LOC117813771 isoform X2 [Notolabrus celidotus]
MSDFEDMDSFWESWITPGKRKRGKESKENKKRPKNKNNSAVKTDKPTQRKKKKKKKNSKFKEVMKSRKEERKEKKKGKHRLALEPDDSFVVAQGSGGQAKPAGKPQTLNPLNRDKLQRDGLTEDPKKKDRRKKKVAFDLSPGYIRVRRPTCVSSSQQSPKESLFSESEPVRESCSQVTMTPHNNESQCSSEDINSQDLFITQKTFRAPPSQPSSDEASHIAMAQMEQHYGDSFQRSQDTHFYQHHRETTEHVQNPKTERVLPTEKREEDRMVRKERCSLQSHTIHAKGKKDPRPIYTKPRVVHPFLEPVVVLPSPEVSKSKNKSLSSSQQSTTCRQSIRPPKVSMTSTSTQTENFYTTELSSYLKFSQKDGGAVLSEEDFKPLDLSLPVRARRDPGNCLSVKTFSVSGETESDNHKNLHPSCISDTIEVLKEPRSDRAGSSQSESDNKSADTTISSEDSQQSSRTGPSSPDETQ